MGVVSNAERYDTQIAAGLHAFLILGNNEESPLALFRTQKGVAPRSCLIAAGLLASLILGNNGED